MYSSTKSKKINLISSILKNLIEFIKIINNLIKRFENFIKKKENNLLEKRKEILLKFKKQFPIFKKEILGSLFVGIVVYIGFIILNFFYSFPVIDINLDSEKLYLTMPKEMFDSLNIFNNIKFTYNFHTEIFCFPDILRIPWMYHDILDVYNYPLAPPLAPGFIHLYYHPL